jgi:hypothetical protein
LEKVRKKRQKITRRPFDWAQSGIDKRETMR